MTDARHRRRADGGRRPLRARGDARRRATRSAASSPATSCMRDHATTGDGLLTGLHLLGRMAATGAPLAELAAVDDPAAAGAGQRAGRATRRRRRRRRARRRGRASEARARRHRRVLLRPSGTEPLVRVMVEAETAERADEVAGGWPRSSGGERIWSPERPERSTARWAWRSHKPRQGRRPGGAGDLEQGHTVLPVKNLTRDEARDAGRAAATSRSYDVHLDLTGGGERFGSDERRALHLPRARARHVRRARRRAARRASSTGGRSGRWRATGCALTDLAGGQPARRSARGAPTAARARGCTASSTRPTARSTSTRRASSTTRSGSSPASTSPTSRRRSRCGRRPGRLERARQRPRHAAAGGPLGVRADRARSAPTCSRSRPGPGTPCTAGTTASTLGPALPRGRWPPHLDADADELLAGDRAVPRLPAGAVRPAATRSATPTTRCSCPSSTPARWRTRARSPSPTTFVFRSRSPTTSAGCAARSIAHEMAHMWFGDLVTMRWWDDLWLNESFAELHGLPHRRPGDPLRRTPGRLQR